MLTTHRQYLLMDVAFPGDGALRAIALVACWSAIVAVSAQVALPLPFTPVPLTAQTLAVLLAGATLGPRLGTIALVAYAAEGAVGLPVFAGLKGGVVALIGPTGGYVVGFIAAAAVVGWLAQRGWDRTPMRVAAAMVLGNLLIYAFGVAWLSRFVPGQALLVAGVIPFLPGDLIKIVLAVVVLPGAWALAGPAYRRPFRARRVFTLPRSRG